MWYNFQSVIKTKTYLYQFLKMFDIKVGKKGDLEMHH